MLVEVERLVEAIEGLDACDPADLDDTALHDVTVALGRAGGRLAVVAGKALARWESRGVWASDQSRTSAARLSRELNCSTRTAKTQLRLARRLDTVPGTVAAVSAGSLSPDHIGLLAAARNLAPERFETDEAMLVAQCATLRFRQAAQLVAYWRLHANPDGEADRQQRLADAARVHASDSLDGTVHLTGILDPIGGSVFLNELHRLEQRQCLADERDGVTRTAAQRRAVALVEMATRSAAARKGSKRPRPLFTVLLGDDSFRQLCETTAGQILPPGALTPCLDTADMDDILFDGLTTVISASHRRSFTGAVRRAIKVRDRHCQHPSGCDVPADLCDIDHIVSRCEGGVTDQFYGRLECPTHNRHPHRHDTAEPPPPREISILDEIRARLRWIHHHLDPPDDPDDPDEAAA
jgi:hypothetical protein